MNTPTELMKLHAEACQAQVDGTAKEFDYYYEGVWASAGDGPFSFSEDGSLMISPLIRRVKPQPKLRPWRELKDVPVHAWFRTKGKSSLELMRVACIVPDAINLLCIREEGLTEYRRSWAGLLADCEYSVDSGDTWLPCGVEE